MEDEVDVGEKQRKPRGMRGQDLMKADGFPRSEVCEVGKRRTYLADEI